MVDTDAGLSIAVGVSLVAFVAVSYAIAWRARDRISTVDDFLVAGRRLPLLLCSATVLATWFGAGTMLTAADEVRAEGTRAAALEPVGSGVCLLLAGLLFARRLWEMKLLTIGDIFAVRYGRLAEVLCGCFLVPTYVGWIAVQFLALASIGELFFDVDPAIGVVVVAAVATGYTLMGGMWSVTLTDGIQVALLLVGLLVLGAAVWTPLRDTPREAWPAGFWDPIPRETAGALMGWVGTFAVAALGNLPSQELMQRMWSARSATVAKRACLIAGGAYLLFGLIPVALGAAAFVVEPTAESAIVPALAKALLSTPVAVVMVVALAAAVFSTIDSALLGPAAVIARNLVPGGSQGSTRGERALGDVRLAVVGIAAVSVVVAWVGESAYALLESAYALGLVSLLVPLSFALLDRRGAPAVAVTAMLSGTSVWVLHLSAGWETFLGLSAPVPPELGCAAVALAVQGTGSRLFPAVEPSQSA